MAGLLDGYGTDPLNQGLLQAGVALMTPRAMGGGVPGALLGFNQGAMMAQQYRRALEQDARRNKLIDAQIAHFGSEDELRKMKIAQAKAELDRQERIRQRLGGMGGDTSSAAPAGPAVEMPTTLGFGGGFMAPGGPMPDTQAPSFGMGGAQPAAQRPTKLGAFNQYSNIAKIYESEGDLETATKYRDMAMKAMPEVKNIETVLVGGKPTMRLFFKDGTYEDVTDAMPKANVESVNFGGYRQNLNKDTGQYEGAQIPITMDEAQRMSARQRQQEIGLSGARLGLERERFGFERAQADRPRFSESMGGYISPPSANAPGGVLSPTTLAGGGAIPPKASDIAKSEADIRKEFAALPEVKSYKEVVPVINSAKKAADNASGDISIIYAVGKVMDPNSVVREGEMNLVIKSGSPAERLMGMVNYVQNGGRLTPSQRKNLLAELDMRARSYESSYKSARGAYEGIVERNKLNAQNVFSDIPAIEATPEGPVDFKDMGARGKGKGKSEPRVINFGDLTGKL